MNYLIVGGTGTLGTAVIRALLKRNRKTVITVFSRDELKQKKTKELFPTVNCVLGDIRDLASLQTACRGKDVVFHFAALKHVEVAEANPEECIKTNVFGTINVARACLDNGVKYCVFSSTDKAVLAINTYGMSKAISEKYLHQMNSYGITHFSVFRWGNVLGSRGSVIHSFIDSLKKNKTVYITDTKMTRFWIHIDDAVRYMLDNFDDAPADRPLIPSMKAAPVVQLARLTADHLGMANYKVEISGVRPGEKFHECILSDHERCVRSDNHVQYNDEELTSLIARTI